MEYDDNYDFYFYTEEYTLDVDGPGPAEETTVTGYKGVGMPWKAVKPGATVVSALVQGDIPGGPDAASYDRDDSNFNFDNEIRTHGGIIYRLDRDVMTDGQHNQTDRDKDHRWGDHNDLLHENMNHWGAWKKLRPQEEGLVLYFLGNEIDPAAQAYDFQLNQKDIDGNAVENPVMEQLAPEGTFFRNHWTYDSTTGWVIDREQEGFWWVGVSGTYSNRMTIASETSIYITGELVPNSEVPGEVDEDGEDADDKLLGLISDRDVLLQVARDPYEDSTAIPSIAPGTPPSHGDSTWGVPWVEADPADEGAEKIDFTARVHAAVNSGGRFTFQRSSDDYWDTGRRALGLKLTGSFFWAEGDTLFQQIWANRTYQYDFNLQAMEGDYVPPAIPTLGSRQPDFRSGSWHFAFTSSD
jgi:hypothetical protein